MGSEPRAASGSISTPGLGECLSNGWRMTMTKVYSARAQPLLDAIAEAVFSRQKVRDWLVAKTRHAQVYTGTKSLHREQERLRPNTKLPFYCTYFCGKDFRCTCRIERSRSLENDAMFFLEGSPGEGLVYMSSSNLLANRCCSDRPRATHCVPTVGQVVASDRRP